MKNLFKLAIATLLPLLTACSVTQIVKDDANFTGLTRFYVENPENVQALTSYYLNNAEINTAVVENIREFLKGRGYQIVEKKADAQIIFRPIWNYSIKDKSDDVLNNPILHSVDAYNYGAIELYSTLEIQAYFPNRADWVWRGFSPINMDKRNATSGLIADQVRWCLEYFPPEKYPTRMQIYKKERAEKLKKQKEQEENPFAHIKVEKPAQPQQNEPTK